MSKLTATPFTTDTGRVVWGSLYEPRTTDYEGAPLTIKSGPDAGKPTQRYEFGLAIAKQPTDNGHWANSKLGAILWAQGHKDHAAMAQRPDFAWKVVDGDSAVPNKKGNLPKDKEGFPGHWVFNFSSTMAPRIVNANGSAYLLEPNAVKCGDYVQVAGSVVGNTGATPGIYVNHNFVALQGRGAEIQQGPDPKSLGFGQGPQPAAMSQVPPGAMTAPPATAPPAATATPPPPAATPPAALPSATPPQTPAPPAATAVQPNPGFLNGAAPAAPGAPAAPAAPVAPVGPQMTAKAGATPYAAFIQQGWTDATLRAHGYMV